MKSVPQVLFRCLFALLLVCAAAPAAWAQATPKTRVVFQVSDADPAKWNLTLNNVKNVQADLGAQNVEIEVVAYGPGIGFLKLESVAGERVREVLGHGVSVAACENTMHNQKLTKQDMLPGISYVPAGVVELIKRQQQGWAYIRP
ncbi:MAG TPA: DsrE family protein [Burkholderiales bacterium]